MTQGSSSRRYEPFPLRSPNHARKLVERLCGARASLSARRNQVRRELDSLGKALHLAEGVSDALQWLSQELFAELIDILQSELSLALQEVLEQDLELRVERSSRSGSAALQFSILHRGQEEDILRGQGGSVANVLSVGLRLFALTTLNRDCHRRFLVLDEQDAWLRPDIVPLWARIIREAAKALGFQVMLISHHDRSLFESHVDRILTVIPSPQGVVLRTDDLMPESST